jgi:predicted phage-related endonuclease
MFEVDPGELREVIADARHYANDVLATMAQAEALSTSDCEDRILPATDDVIEMYRKLSKTRERYDTLGFEKDYLEAQLKVVIGTASGIERVADWKTVVTHRLDGERLKLERPDVFSAFVTASCSRRFNLL